MHSLGIVHGDLKPGNVLLKSVCLDRRGFTVRVADFGFSTRAGVLGEYGGVAYAWNVGGWSNMMGRGRWGGPQPLLTEGHYCI